MLKLVLTIRLKVVMYRLKIFSCNKENSLIKWSEVKKSNFENLMNTNTELIQAVRALPITVYFFLTNVCKIYFKRQFIVIKLSNNKTNGRKCRNT